MLAKRYDGKSDVNINLKGMMLYVLIFPLLVATFFSLASGDVKKFVFNLSAYVVFFAGIKVAKKGFEEEKKYNSSKLSLAPKSKYKLKGAMIVGVGSFIASMFCVENSLVSSVMLALATTVGFVFYYGLDPSEDKVDTTLSKILEDAIEVVEDVKLKLSELEKINYKFDNKEIKESFRIIINDIEGFVKKVEDDPRILTKVRKFFKVYLARVVEISKEFSSYDDIDKSVEDRFVSLLDELKQTVVQQKKLLEEKDLTGLDIQIEALQKQLKNEGV